MKRINLFKKIPGFEPNKKSALSRGQIIKIENKDGKMVCVVTNTCNADKDGVCSAHMMLKEFAHKDLR